MNQEPTGQAPSATLLTGQAWRRDCQMSPARAVFWDPSCLADCLHPCSHGSDRSGTRGVWFVCWPD